MTRRYEVKLFIFIFDMSIYLKKVFYFFYWISSRKGWVTDPRRREINALN